MRGSSMHAIWVLLRRKNCSRSLFSGEEIGFILKYSGENKNKHASKDPYGIHTRKHQFTSKTDSFRTFTVN